VPEQPPLEDALHRFLAEAGLKAVDGGWTWKFDPALFDHLEMGIDQVDRFAQLKCPSAVILGEHSADDGARSGPFLSAATGGLLPIITLPDQHHHMMFENPMALLAAFEGFLDSWRANAKQETLRERLAALPTYPDSSEEASS
jgi:pimeloyl-ACP methyl ester carboxylesterase